eukprot:TRINITY_DN2052_c0_g2_i1.p1 TRINITY_DN2052_c0_g2~~TRINITY_DN2052_c0_g2_i1.p1  ORF type:complete len:552 (-),score=95.54 TRINITY_DN2052_c0_g2_i1:9-1664(-)
MSYVIGVDVGTTSVRSIVWDKQGKKVSEAQSGLTTNVTPSGHATSDALLVFDTTVKVMQDSFASSNLSPQQINSIGLATQRASLVIWEKDTGKPVYPMILWSDTRTSEETVKANNSVLPYIVRTVSGVMYFLTKKPKFLTGAHFQISTTNVGLKVKQLLLNNPHFRQGVLSGSLLLGTLDTWLIWKFTNGAKYVTEWSNLSATAMWDPYDRSWSDIVAWIISPRPGEFYPSKNIFPTTINDTIDDYGTTHPDIFGIPIPINAVIGDQQASLFGHGCFRRGDAKITLGTGGFLVQNTGPECLASKHHIFPLVAWKIGNETTFMLEGNLLSVGTTIDWLINNNFAPSYDALDAPSPAPRPDPSSDVYFVPAFGGLHTPFFNADARGLFVGLHGSLSKQDMVRAVLESFGWSVGQIVRALHRDTRLPVPSLKVDGGVSRNRTILQGLADATGCAVYVSSIVDVTSRGAAFLAGLRGGVWGSLGEIEELIKDGGKFECKMEEEERALRSARFDEATRRALDWKAKPRVPREDSRGWTKGMVVLVVLFCVFVWWDK